MATWLHTVTVLVDVPGTPAPTHRGSNRRQISRHALPTQANWLVTGDRDFTQARKLVTTTILSVSQFKTLVCDLSLWPIHSLVDAPTPSVIPITVALTKEWSRCRVSVYGGCGVACVSGRGSHNGVGHGWVPGAEDVGTRIGDGIVNRPQQPTGSSPNRNPHGCCKKSFASRRLCRRQAAERLRITSIGGGEYADR